MKMDDLVIKEGDLFLLTDRRGDASGDYYGLYYRDTQYLDRWHLTLGPRPLRVLSARASEGWRSTVLLTTDPPAESAGLSPNEVEVLRSHLIADRTLYEEIRVSNRNLAPAAVALSLEFGSAFADLFEYRGAARIERGRDEPPQPEASRVVLRYSGLDGVHRRTVIRWSRPPRSLALNAADGSQGLATWDLSLGPGETAVLTMTVTPLSGEEQPPEVQSLRPAAGAVARSYADWIGNVTQIECDHLDVQGVLRRCLHDLRLLRQDLGHGPFLAAGMPWLTTLVGRDALIASYQSLLLDPAQAQGVLRTLAAWQGRQVDPERGEEPGKILDQLRLGEMANLGEVPFGRHYGSVDGTPLFLMLLAEYHRWTGDGTFLQEMLPAARTALAWIEEWGDRDGDGLLECLPGVDSGQTWKRAASAIFRRDGSLPEGPVAVVEVQGYAYAALRGMAEVFDHLGFHDEARGLQGRADRLQRAFEERFWMADQGYYCLALDGEKHQVETVTSNPGHCLWTGIVAPDRADRIVERLLAPGLFSGWGIRTMSAEEPQYSPLSQFNGAVWPHDSSLIAMGLSRYGYSAQAARLAASLLRAALQQEEKRLPATFCGYPAEDGPPVCWQSTTVQAWTAASPFLLLRTLLGFEPDVPNGIVRLRPAVPREMGTVTLKGLRVGFGTLDLMVNGTQATVTQNTTGLKVVVEPS